MYLIAAHCRDPGLLKAVPRKHNADFYDGDDTYAL